MVFRYTHTRGCSPGIPGSAARTIWSQVKAGKQRLSTDLCLLGQKLLRVHWLLVAPNIFSIRPCTIRNHQSFAAQGTVTHSRRRRVRTSLPPQRRAYQCCCRCKGQWTSSCPMLVSTLVNRFRKRLVVVQEVRAECNCQEESCVPCKHLDASN